MKKLILGVAPALILMSGAAAASPLQWRVSEVSGNVRLTENGKARSATRGALLASGATITTAAGARAVIVRGEEFVVISPRTQLRVPAAERGNGITQLFEDFGTALFKIGKKSTPHFGVQTPYLAAVVKGTSFTVTVGAQGSTVQVSEGAVQVSTLDGGATDLVMAGAVAMVEAGDRGKLSIDGAVSKVIRSNGAPAAVTSGPSPAENAPAVRIGAPIAEASRSLESTTGGLVAGEASFQLAAAEASDAARFAEIGRPAPEPVGEDVGEEQPAEGSDSDGDDDAAGEDGSEEDKGGDKGKPDKDGPGKDKGDGDDKNNGAGNDKDRDNDNGGGNGNDRDNDNGGGKGKGGDKGKGGGQGDGDDDESGGDDDDGTSGDDLDDFDDGSDNGDESEDDDGSDEDGSEDDDGSDDDGSDDEGSDEKGSDKDEDESDGDEDSEDDDSGSDDEEDSTSGDDSGSDKDSDDDSDEGEDEDDSGSDDEDGDDESGDDGEGDGDDGDDD